MKLDRWSTLRGAVEAALGAESDGERDSILSNQCGDDDALLDEARSLLACADRLPAEPPWGNAAAAILTAEEAGRSVGRRFGSYRAVQVIAAGPGGTVLRATRDDCAFEKDVAVKVLRRGLDTPEAMRRFERERRILARLAHPAISTLLDAGIADDGSPYIVMEFVEGVPITEHCTERALGVRARVALLRQACDAIAHAHAAGVIHRDLKPANLLVTPQGGVKLIDFGVARLLEGAAPADATEHGRLLGTVNYMSPEQVTGGAIDARTDVHALGLILYELLAGRPAFDLASVPVATAAAALSTESPPRLSGLNRALRGDLERIVSKAIEKDPALRYQSAAAFDDDLRRYLEHLPVSASRPALLYRARKLIRRRPALAAAAAALALGAVITAASIVSGAAATRREADRARAVSAFLGDVLRSADPFSPTVRGIAPSGPRELTDLLLEAARRLDTGAIADARTESDIRHAVGQALSGRGRPHDAERQHRRALALREAALGPEHHDSLESQVALAGVLVTLQQFPEARALLRHARSSLAGGGNSPLSFTADVSHIACTLFEGSIDEARAAAEELWARAPSMTGEERPALAAAVAAIAAAASGDRDRAESLGNPALATLDRLGSTHPVVGLCASTLAAEAELAGDTAKAEGRYRQAVASFRATVGNDDPRTALMVSSYAQMLCRSERFTEAEPHARHAVTVLARDYRPAHALTAAARETLALSLQGQDRLGEAAAELERLLADCQAAANTDPVTLASARTRLALVRAQQGRLDQAEQLARTALKSLAAVPPAHVSRLIAQEALARILLQQGNREAARALIVEAMHAIAQNPPLDPSIARRLEALLVECREHSD